MRVEPGQYAHAFVNGAGNIHGLLFRRLENLIQKIFRMPMPVSVMVKRTDIKGYHSLRLADGF